MSTAAAKAALVGPPGKQPTECITHAPSGTIYVWLPERDPRLTVDGETVVEAEDGRGLWVRVTELLTPNARLLTLARTYGIEWVRNWVDFAEQVRRRGAA